MRARLFIVAALALLALAPSSAAAAKLTSFELPDPRIDASTPGGQLADGRTIPKVNVLLPDGYEPGSERRWPVLWLLHGANGGTDNWIPGIEQLLAGLPAIVVMPDGGKVGMYTDWWNDGARSDPAWATYHLTAFRREVERRYPIRPGRRWHAIAGISMGGQGTLRYAAMLPGYFGSAVGLSAAVPDMQSPEARFGIELAIAANGGGASYDSVFGPRNYAEGNSPLALAANLGHTRLYLTAGNGVNCPQDPVNAASYALDIVTESAIHAQQGPFAEAARAAGADVTSVERCGVHTFGVWDRAFPEALAWGLFKPVETTPRNWTYRTIATAGEMWGLRFRFSAPPSVIAGFERSGRMLTGTGSGEVRIRGGRGCRFTDQLPFLRALPRACRHPQRSQPK